MCTNEVSAFEMEDPFILSNSLQDTYIVLATAINYQLQKKWL